MDVVGLAEGGRRGRVGLEDLFAIMILDIPDTQLEGQGNEEQQSTGQLRGTHKRSARKKTPWQFALRN